ncbi:unnamed protein product [Cuscuta campestris]|uniref:4a-hydroxytetrahydrobiopterin dehydratase n=1 Tax=Cuscuta campestris TaxID=132261 RepID=A0A484LNG2_9ASTE|nr:unnamed protein product [Cuscuta campestris]
MAGAAPTRLCLFPSIPPSTHKTPKPPALFPPRCRRRRIHKPHSPGSRILPAASGESPHLLGDFGGRDPFPAEIESGFCEKVLGDVDTEHKILIPSASALSLAQRTCTSITPPLSDLEARQLLLKVVGWRVTNEGGGLRLQCTWKVRDSDCGTELVKRINQAVEGTGHSSDLLLEQECGQVRARLWTASVGGLSLNDFILAAKIDAVKTSDLSPTKRVWA